MPKLKNFRYITSRVGILAFLVILALLAPFSAWSEPLFIIREDPFKETEKGFFTTLFFCDVPIMKLYADSSEKLREDADVMEKKLGALCNQQLKSSDFKVRATGKSALILIKGRPFYEVTEAQAQSHGKTSYSLAAGWMQNLRSAISRFRLWEPSRDCVLIPLGEKREIQLRGSVKGKVELLDYESSIVSATYDAASKSVMLEGLDMGHTSLFISNQGIKHKLSISVKKYAGYLPESIDVITTGDIISKSTLRKAIISNLRLRAALAPDALLSLSEDDLARIPGLQTGKSKEMTISATVNGSDYIPIQRQIFLRLENRIFNPREAALLLLSNNPEKIEGDGELFSADLSSGDPTRFVFHHFNSQSSKNRRFIIKLVNKGGSDSMLHISHSMGGPGNDEIYTGYKASLLFWEQYLHSAGWMVTIPPGREYILDEVTIKTAHVVSGVSLFTPVEGPAPRIILETAGGGNSNGIENDESSRVSGAFQRPEINLQKRHMIGKGYTFFYLGGAPYLKELRSGRENAGNYGVMYKIIIDIENDSEEEKEAEVFFTPGAGPARGIFLIDDTLISTTVGRHLEEISLSKYILGPFEKRSVKIETLPVSGSNYPVNIVVKSKIVKE